MSAARRTAGALALAALASLLIAVGVVETGFDGAESAAVTAVTERSTPAAVRDVGVAPESPDPAVEMRTRKSVAPAGRPSVEVDREAEDATVAAGAWQAQLPERLRREGLEDPPAGYRGTPLMWRLRQTVSEEELGWLVTSVGRIGSPRDRSAIFVQVGRMKSEHVLDVLIEHADAVPDDPPMYLLWGRELIAGGRRAFNRAKRSRYEADRKRGEEATQLGLRLPARAAAGHSRSWR